MCFQFKLNNVTYAYPGRPACLVDVSFEVHAGERVALLGANGSGKSTLLHLLDGLYFSDEGTISAFGEVLTEESVESGRFGPRFRREVGFLFQNSDAQLFCSSVEDELAFGPLQMGLGVGEIRRRIADTLELLKIEHLRERSPQNLSAGEKKRVALASILVTGPSVLLLDEPSAGLDPRSRSHLIETLRALSDTGLTLVVATHDLEIVPRIADRAIVLGEDHKLMADAGVREVLSDDKMLYSVNLIG